MKNHLILFGIGFCLILAFVSIAMSGSWDTVRGPLFVTLMPQEKVSNVIFFLNATGHNPTGSATIYKQSATVVYTSTARAASAVTTRLQSAVATTPAYYALVNKEQGIMDYVRITAYNATLKRATFGTGYRPTKATVRGVGIYTLSTVDTIGYLGTYPLKSVLYASGSNRGLVVTSTAGSVIVTYGQQ